MMFGNLIVRILETHDASQLTTWNINSVRLRIDLVAKFIKACGRISFACRRRSVPTTPSRCKRFRRLGYEHVALNGQKGYHGVAVVSRLRSSTSTFGAFAARPIAAMSVRCLVRSAGLRDPMTLHNFYVPAGGDEPDPVDQSEIRSTSSRSSTKCAPMRTCCRTQSRARSSWAILMLRRSSTTCGATSR